jgi:hypothetical protein
VFADCIGNICNRAVNGSQQQDDLFNLVVRNRAPPITTSASMAPAGSAIDAFTRPGPRSASTASHERVRAGSFVAGKSNSALVSGGHPASRRRR